MRLRARLLNAFLLPAGVLAAALLAAGPCHADDFACVGSRGFGVTCAIDNGWRNYTKKSGELVSDYVYDMAACGGKILVAAANAVHVFDGKRWTKPNLLPSGLARHLSCDPAGGYWVASDTRLAYWNGKAWKLVDTGTLLNDQTDKYINGLAAGPDGTAWIVAGGRMAALYKDGRWTVYREGAGFNRRLYLSRILIGRAGFVWLPHPGGVTWLDGTWKSVAGPGTAHAVAQSPSGALWLANGRRLTRFKDKAWKVLTAPSRINAVAAGADNRVWVATTFGLGVLAGESWTWRQMNNSALTSNNLSAVAVVGNGGVLPPMAPQSPGALTGRFEWDDGKPVAGAQVQICGAPPAAITVGARTPCTDRPLLRSTTTDDQGRFTLANVPPATYYITLFPKDGRRWLISYSIRRTRVGPGESRDSGTWRIQSRGNRS
jgi:hypothetical protein